jgi:hypothetical protein
MADSGGGLGPKLAVGLIVCGLLVLLGVGSALAFVCLRPASSDQEVSRTTENLPAPPWPAKDTAQAPAKKAENDVPPPGPLPKDDAKGQPPPNVDVPKKDARPGPQDEPVKPKEPPPPEVDPAKGSPGQKPMVWGAQQREIDGAIDRGVKFLRDIQNADGSWPGNGHALGTTALPALTLLECGVPANDARITAAAQYVRKKWMDNKATYEIALAILFLDKLGDKKDKPIIQALALRLIAAQNANGGWDYDCHMLSNAEATQLLTMLKKNRPKVLPAAVDKGEKTGPLPAPVDKGDKANLPSPVDKSSPDESPTVDPKRAAPGGMGFFSPGARLGEEAPLLAGPAPNQVLVDPLQHAFAAVQPPKATNKGPKDQPKGPKMRSDRDDNSNTQFAMLGLWAARRHDVPVENALTLVEQRFRASQHADTGAWGYHFKDTREKPSMTCVGLLGIALGKGSAAEIAVRGVKPGAAPHKKLPLDQQIRKGLEALVPHLDKRTVQNQEFPSGLSLYFMWSVERVAVLYDLRRIGDRDWYLWGTEILLPTQRANGSWQTYSFPGSNATIDTCFALLFLKRVNLVQDLTDNLRLYMAVPDFNEEQQKIQ